MSKLNDLIISLVTESGLNDYDQRSAIGMARNWVDKREPIKSNPEQVQFPKRDKLARDLVAAMEENPAEESEYVAALNEARKIVNAPHNIGEVHSSRNLGKPKERKAEGK
jgi:hypothetical protein